MNASFVLRVCWASPTKVSHLWRRWKNVAKGRESLLELKVEPSATAAAPRKKRNKDGNNTVRLGGLERRAPARALLYIHTRTCFRICTVTRSRVLLFLSHFLSTTLLVLLTLSMKKTFCLVGSAAGCGRVQGCTPCRYPLVAFFLLLLALSLSLGRFYCFLFSLSAAYVS